MTSVGYFVLGAALVVFICVVCIKLALIIFILQMKKQRRNNFSFLADGESGFPRQLIIDLVLIITLTEI